MYHFIVNIKSRTGKAKKIWEEVKEELERLHVEYEVHVTKYAGHAIDVARKLARDHKGSLKIVVLGGDGTFNEVVNGARNFDRIEYGYIPTGSGNDLARGLKLSKDPIVNLHSILESETTFNMDIGCLSWDDDESKRYFAVSSGVGVDADVCRRVLYSNLKKILNKLGLGKLTYILITLQSLALMPNLTAHIVCDGKDYGRVGRGIFIAFMNQKCEGGGVMMSPKADPFDGKIDMCCIFGMTKFVCFLALTKLIRAKHESLKGYLGVQFEKADIILETPFVWHTDGEVIAYNTVMHLECLAGALKILNKKI